MLVRTPGEAVLDETRANALAGVLVLSIPLAAVLLEGAASDCHVSAAGNCRIATGPSRL